MKKEFIAFCVILMILQSAGYCQGFRDTVKRSVISSYNLLITTGKTTNLVFPYAIRSADRGTGDVIAQQVKGVENILQVKAAVKNFAETNLTVITSDGSLFSFLVNYSPDPKELNIRFGKDTISAVSYGSKDENKLPVSFSDVGNNAEEVERISKRLLTGKGRMIHGVKDKKYETSIRLMSMHVKQNVLYCQLEFMNSSNIDYDVDMIRFFIRDKRQAKRSATQETELAPLYVAGYPSLINAHTKKVWVYAFQKFTIPDAKYLWCEIKEKNGARNLRIRIKNSRIIHAHMIGGDL